MSAASSAGSEVPWVGWLALGEQDLAHQRIPQPLNLVVRARLIGAAAVAVVVVSCSAVPASAVAASATARREGADAA